MEAKYLRGVLCNDHTESRETGHGNRIEVAVGNKLLSEVGFDLHHEVMLTCYHRSSLHGDPVLIPAKTSPFDSGKLLGDPIWDMYCPLGPLALPPHTYIKVWSWQYDDSPDLVFRARRAGFDIRSDGAYNPPSESDHDGRVTPPDQCYTLPCDGEERIIR